ncbi:hypothetical protein AURDEDRAFT_128952 [Auricularia subglabra TFB-10046 SS5]|nr:hypothetical protein AURDEDRAFT_128952 [Auricularia subglabra TFB-10046 SS5]
MFLSSAPPDPSNFYVLPVFMTILGSGLGYALWAGRADVWVFIRLCFESCFPFSVIPRRGCRGSPASYATSNNSSSTQPAAGGSELEMVSPYNLARSSDMSPEARNTHACAPSHDAYARRPPTNDRVELPHPHIKHAASPTPGESPIGASAHQDAATSYFDIWGKMGDPSDASTSALPPGISI